MPFKVGFVSWHACIRAMKQAWMLTEAGHDVHFAASLIPSVTSYNSLKSVSIFHDSTAEGLIDPRQLANWVQTMNSVVDLYHVHNEPNWIYRAVRENTTKPVIWDIHDWTSLRRVKPSHPEELEHEKIALETADAFVVCSAGYLKRIREVSKKPSILLYSAVPAFLFPKKAEDPLPSLVYEGGTKGRTDIRYNYPYRNWAQVAQKVAETDDVYFYTANPGEDLSEYNHPRIKFSDPVPYDLLITALSRHTAGLVGSPFPVADFDDAMPNKLFEYVAAGIPCIVLNSPEAKNYVEFHGLGVGIRDPSEIHDALTALTDHKVRRDRWGFTMDAQIPKLFALYEEVLCTRSPRAIARMANYGTATDADLAINVGSNFVSKTVSGSVQNV